MLSDKLPRHRINGGYGSCRASQVALVVKNPPASAENIKEQGFDPWRRPWQPTVCSILAWRTQWTEEPGGLLSIGFQRVRHD